MEALSADEITQAAADMFNALSRTHNTQIDRFSAAGMSSERAALASYMALGVMLQAFIEPVKTIVPSEHWNLIRTIMRVMHQQAAETSAKTVPTARA